MTKARCHHHKIPAYTAEEQKTREAALYFISQGLISYYSMLTHLAVKVAQEGRFTRETCKDCNE